MKYLFGLLMLTLTFVFTSPPCFAIQDVPTAEKKVYCVKAIEIFDFKVSKIADSGGLPYVLFEKTKQIVFYDFKGSFVFSNNNLIKSHYFDWNDSYLCNFVTHSYN